MWWEAPESIIHVVDSASDASAQWPSCEGPPESIGLGIHIRPTEQAKSSTAAGLAIVPSKATESASQSKSSSLPCVWVATTSAWESSFASSALPELRLLRVSCCDTWVRKYRGGGKDIVESDSIGLYSQQNNLRFIVSACFVSV